MRSRFPALSWTTHEQACCFHIAGHRLPMSMFAGHMLVDSAAGHPTCGGAYFAALESCLNAACVKSTIIYVEKATIPIKTRGFRGSALTKEIRLVPLRLCNAAVFVEMLILKNDVPPLLAVTFVDSYISDLQKNLIIWQWSDKDSFVKELHPLKRKHCSQCVQLSRCRFQSARERIQKIWCGSL